MKYTNSKDDFKVLVEQCGFTGLWEEKSNFI